MHYRARMEKRARARARQQPGVGGGGEGWQGAGVGAWAADGNGVTSDEIRETRVRRGSPKLRRAHRRLNAIKPVEQQQQHRPTTIPSFPPFLLFFSRFRISCSRSTTPVFLSVTVRGDLSTFAFSSFVHSRRIVVISHTVRN